MLGWLGRHMAHMAHTYGESQVCSVGHVQHAKNYRRSVKVFEWYLARIGKGIK